MTSGARRQAAACSYTCWIMGLRPSMTRGFPGKRDDPYRAGITTMTDGLALVMAEHLRKLLCREGGGADHADDDTCGIVGQRCSISRRRAGRQREGQRPDHRITRTGDIEDLAGLSGNVPGGALSLVQTHPFFAARNEHRLASQPLSYDRAGLVDRLIVLAVHPGGLCRLMMVWRDDRRPLVVAEVFDFRIDDQGYATDCGEPREFRHQCGAHDSFGIVRHHETG